MERPVSCSASRLSIVSVARRTDLLVATNAAATATTFRGENVGRKRSPGAHIDPNTACTRTSPTVGSLHRGSSVWVRRAALPGVDHLYIVGFRAGGSSCSLERGRVGGAPRAATGSLLRKARLVAGGRLESRDVARPPRRRRARTTRPAIVVEHGDCGAAVLCPVGGRSSGRMRPIDGV